MVAALGVFDGDYAGATMGTATLRATAEALPSPREMIGVPFQWRRRQVAGGGSSPVMKNVGGETSLNGIAPGAGIAAAVWLTNAPGIGLGGPDGVDNITAITIDWRGQKFTQNLDPMFLHARLLAEKRTSPISNGPAAALADAANWPSSMSSALQTGTTSPQRPSADPDALLLPMVLPGRQLETSKIQRVLGDLQTDFTTTVPVSAAHEFMTWELLEFTEQQVGALSALGLFQGEARRKNLLGNPGTRGNFRYSAIDFPKRA
jgi:hypothetical protein